MNGQPRLIARIALMAALIYVLSWGTSYLPNVNLAFFIAFMAGYLWGLMPGILVGAVGMWLWTSLNPFGPATLPVALAQVLGMAGSGLIGALVRRFSAKRNSVKPYWLALGAAAIACTLIFYTPVIVIDAWLFQPFWPRLLGGLPFVAISLVANLIIFPLLFGVTLRISDRTKAIGS